MMQSQRLGDRAMVKLIIIVALAAAIQVCDGPQASRGQSVDGVSATVRASGLRAELVAVPSRVRVGALVLGVLFVTNVSDESVLIVHTSLAFNTGAFKTLLRFGGYPLLLRPHRRIISTWLLQARHPGKFVIVASITTLNSNLSTVRIESGGELIDVRQR